MKRRSATTTVLICTAVVALLALVVAAGVWRSEGGRWYDVRTASMGTAAPVGTLLLTRPASVHDLEKGDLVTFHAPGSGQVYSHRVVAVTQDGLRTRGDVNPAPDAWTIHQDDIVGKVVWRAHALGWLVRGFPLLLLCAGVVWLVSTLVGSRLRGPVRVLGASASFAAAGLLLHPWVALQRISTARADEGVVIRVVSTGLFPVRASAIGGGGSARLTDGATAGIHVPHADAHHFYSLATSLSLSLWWWVAVVLLCLAPLLWCLTVGLEPVEDDGAGTHAERADAVDLVPAGVG